MARRRRRRRRAAPRTRTRTVTKYVRRSARAIGSSLRNTKVLGGMTAGAAALGYLEEHSQQFRTYSAKLPVIGNRAISVGLLAHVANKHWLKSKYMDYFAAGALAVGGYQLGQGVKMAGVAGYDDDELDVTEIAGELDPDEDGLRGV